MRRTRPAPVDPHRATAASPLEILRAALRAAEASGDAAAVTTARARVESYERREAERVAWLAAGTAA